jgi:hypothetical protein
LLAFLAFGSFAFTAFSGSTDATATGFAFLADGFFSSFSDFFLDMVPLFVQPNRPPLQNKSSKKFPLK